MTLVDALELDDIERARLMTPDEKAREALDLADYAIELQRIGLRTRHPEATHEELERLLSEWLASDD